MNIFFAKNVADTAEHGPNFSNMMRAFFKQVLRPGAALPRRYARPWRKGRVLVDREQRAAEALEAELAVVEGEELARCRKQANPRTLEQKTER